jgi:hypothetical protein
MLITDYGSVQEKDQKMVETDTSEQHITKHKGIHTHVCVRACLCMQLGYFSSYVDFGYNFRKAEFSV